MSQVYSRCYFYHQDKPCQVPQKMSYISGQQGPFDDQMLRIGASDNYFLSPPPYGGGPDSTGTSTSTSHSHGLGHGPGSGSGPGSGPGMASASASAISMDSELNLSFLQHPGLDVHVKEEDQGFPVLMGGPLSNGMARGHSMVESVPDSITDSMSRRNNNGDSSYTSPMSSGQGQGQGNGSASQTAGQGQGQDKSESSGMKADSEEEQIRRKRAMNRAAQKAFRERKEARVKQLEQQLKDSERDREQLLSELEDLRKHNIEMHAENRILLQTKSAGVPGVPLPLPLAQGLGQGISQGQGINQSIPQDLGAGPGTCPTKFTFPSKRDFVEELIDLQDQTYDAETVSRTQPVNYSHDGQEMMTISATWEYLHKVSERIDFDLSLVMCKLKGKQVCHGKGPSFYKSDVDRYIQEA